MKSAVIVFPGSNCDRDCVTAMARVTGVQSALVWHTETALPDRLDLVILPGGFAHGDYLRSGAMAARSPIMEAVRRHADEGRLVAGICNGFQVLTECGLLPGALMRNVTMRYVCKDTPLAIANPDTAFTRAYGDARETVMPVGNGDGRYFADEETLRRLEQEGRVAFRYLDNPNGSANDIAGIVNDRGNVLGLMPHPDRCADPALGRTGGWGFFQSLHEAAA
ncbi:MAG: phosphoribosylformylglycinamidine synthase subunit PurQ [Hyphomonadaceae bacterium]|nr:phosphoribosylformylglycinamidine synthase subunit PurQ [Hyphomonadaceae bacterium]